ncbi:hypothetical protein CC79DRAFT_1317797 [Sarocladium strictum]
MDDATAASAVQALTSKRSAATSTTFTTSRSTGTVVSPPLSPPSDSDHDDLPAWARAGEDARVQPWRQHAGAESDDRDFAREKDTVPYYDARLQVCYGEGSMAA